MAVLSILQNLRAQNDRREAEMRYERERMEARAEQARNQAVQFAQAGFSIGDIEKAVPHLDLQGYTLAKMVADKAKRDKQAAAAEAEGAAQGRSAQSQLAQLLQNTGGDTSGINPGLLDQIKLGLLQGGESSPASFVDRAAAVEQSNAQAAQRSRIASFQEFLAKEQIKSDTQLRRDLTLDATKRERDRFGSLQDRAVSLYANFLSDAMIEENGGGEGARERVYEAMQSDPALRGNAALLGLVELEAASSVRAAQDESRITRDIHERIGVRVPRPVARALADGKAVEEQFTGLPVRAPTATERQKVSSAGAALDALARAKATAQKIATQGRGGGVLTEAAISPTARYFGLGSEDPLLNEYSAARDQLGEMLTYALTGAQAAQQQIDRILGFMPKATELTRDPRTGGLTQNAQRRIGAAYRLTAALLSGTSLVEPKATQATILRAFDARVSRYAAGEGAEAEPALAPAVRDPRLPAIARPR
jgi:hypothetical protein